LLDEGVLRVPSIRNQIEQGFIAVKMDVSDANNPANAIAASMRVELLPTIVVLDTMGNEVGRLVGAVRPEQFTDFMHQMSKSCYDSPGIP
jgi:thioredoxin-related protein